MSLFSSESAAAFDDSSSTGLQDLLPRVLGTLLQIHAEFFDQKQRNTHHQLSNIVNARVKHSPSLRNLPILKHHNLPLESTRLGSTELQTWTINHEGAWVKEIHRSITMLELRQIRPCDGYQSCAPGLSSIPRRNVVPKHIPLNRVLALDEPYKEQASELSHFIWQRFHNPDCNAFQARAYAVLANSHPLDQAICLATFQRLLGDSHRPMSLSEIDASDILPQSTEISKLLYANRRWRDSWLSLNLAATHS